MNCEEFAKLGLEGDADGWGPEGAEAREHLRMCARCGALQASLQRLRADLRELGRASAETSAPAGVEMRLRREFRARHAIRKQRKHVIVGGWLLAAATLVLVASSLFLVRRPNQRMAGQHGSVPTVPASRSVATGPELGGTVIAENGDEQFALIPGVLPGLQGESSVVRVEMQRGSLGALGLTVNEEHVNDLVQVDLLLGPDGQPQAYRLPASSN